MPTRDPVMVVGAGLVGPVLAIALARRGHQVRVFERRSDSRRAPLERGRSVNVVISHRGWSVLRDVGLEEAVRQICRPLTVRCVHPTDGGPPTRQPYSRSGEAIWCVERPELGALLLDAMDATEGVVTHYGHRCVEVDLKKLRVGFLRDGRDQLVWEPFDRLLATDGAYSGVRSCLLRGRFDYSQEYVSMGYREFRIPGVSEGGPALDLDAFHIWPRGSALFTAFPNFDGSFTGSLFLPHEGAESFAALDTPAAVWSLVRTALPSLRRWQARIAADLTRNPTASMVTIRARPWHRHDRLALVGDAAHAILPFFGQGMNCGFEDVAALVRLLDETNDDWQASLDAYDRERRPNADAIALMSKLHYEALGREDQPTDAQRLEEEVNGLLFSQWPDRFAPLYERVAFSTRPYASVLQSERERQAIVRQVLETPELRRRWCEMGSAVIEQVITAESNACVSSLTRYLLLLERAMGDGCISADERALLDEAAAIMGLGEPTVRWAESFLQSGQPLDEPRRNAP